MFLLFSTTMVDPGKVWINLLLLGREAQRIWITQGINGLWCFLGREVLVGVYQLGQVSLNTSLLFIIFQFPYLFIH